MNSLIQDDTAIVIEKLFSFVALEPSWGRNIWHVESVLQKHLIKRQHSAISFSPVRSLCIALCFVTQAFGESIRLFLECNPIANKFVGFTVAAKEGYYFLALFFQIQSSVQFSTYCFLRVRLASTYPITRCPYLKRIQKMLRVCAGSFH